MNALGILSGAPAPQALSQENLHTVQSGQLAMVADWCERTYPVEDPIAVAYFARKAPEWQGQFMQLEELLGSLHEGQLTIPAVFEQSLTDCFAGLTLYFKNWRCSSTVRWLPCCFVDLDCYRENLTSEQALPHVFEICEAHGIPLPTEVTHTGRGLLARWQLDPVRAWPENVATWDAVQRKLCEFFTSLGADDGARDCARVSRPDGTVNSKSNQMVFTVKGSGDSYTMGEMALAMGVLYRPKRKHQRKRHRIKTSVGTLVPKNPKQFTLSIEGLRRIQDLTELVNLRGTIEEGHRRNFLMFFTSAAMLTNWPEGTIREHVRQFNDGFKDSLSREEVNDAVKQAMAPRRGGRPYKWSSSRIAEQLGITREEEAYMATLVSEAEGDRRKIARRLASETSRHILRAFERNPGARQMDLAELTGFRQGTISKHLGYLELRTTPHQDGRGRHSKHGFTFPQSQCFRGS